ncbi:MAG: FoF1 ATP synthase subunit delta/epsilon [bacterium]
MQGSKPITVKIITPEKTIYDEVVNHAVLPGIGGEAGIFHHHAPFMSYIKPGNLQIHLQNQQIILMPIKSGLIEFKDDFLTILTLEDISQNEISISTPGESEGEEEKEEIKD